METHGWQIGTLANGKVITWLGPGPSPFMLDGTPEGPDSEHHQNLGAALRAATMRWPTRAEWKEGEDPWTRLKVLEALLEPQQRV
jgi:hypothetical protein